MAKKSYFIATNQQAFTESLILQIDPDYLLFNPIPAGLSSWKYEEAVSEAFAKCCSDEFMEIQKRSPWLYDTMVQNAFKDTPSGRQTIERFPICVRTMSIFQK